MSLRVWLGFGIVGLGWRRATEVESGRRVRFGRRAARPEAARAVRDDEARTAAWRADNIVSGDDDDSSGGGGGQEGEN
jgi:hypothetical protein